MKLSSFLCWPHGKFILTEKVRRSTPEPLTNTKHKPIDDQDLRKTILYVMQKQEVTCFVIHVTQLCAGQYHLPPHLNVYSRHLPQEVSPPLLPPASCNPNSLPKFSLIALSINSGLTCCGCAGESVSVSWVRIGNLCCLAAGCRHNITHNLMWDKASSIMFAVVLV